MGFTLLIFDCDGTLVDSEYLNNLATIRLLHDEGLTQYDMDYALKNFVGLRFKNIIASIAQETGRSFPTDMSERYVAMANELMPQYLKKIPGAEELVAAAAQHGKICVASNGQRGNVITALEMTNLKKYFNDDQIFTGTDVANGKPAPDLFLFAANKMKTPIDECLVLEDSVAGVTAAKAANIRVIGFTGAHKNPEPHAETLKTAGATETYDSFIHIRERLFP